MVSNIEDLCSLMIEGIKQEYLKEISLEISYDKTLKSEKPQFEFLNKMESLWRSLGSDFDAIVFMIDEAELLEEIQGSLQFLRNSFTELGMKKCLYTIILSGKLNFPKRMSEAFSPLTRFFHPLELKNLTEKEVFELLEKALDNTNIKMDKECKKRIGEDSEGHPYVVTSLGYVLYRSLPDDEKIITEKHYDRFTPDIMNFLGVEFFRGFYERASLAERILLNEIAEMGGEVRFSKLSRNLKKSKGNIARPLQRLVEKGCIEQPGRGIYKIFNRLFGMYVLKVGNS